MTLCDVSSNLDEVNTALNSRTGFLTEGSLVPIGMRQKSVRVRLENERRSLATRACNCVEIVC